MGVVLLLTEREMRRREDAYEQYESKWLPDIAHGISFLNVGAGTARREPNAKDAPSARAQFAPEHRTGGRPELRTRGRRRRLMLSYHSDSTSEIFASEVRYAKPDAVVLKIGSVPPTHLPGPAPSLSESTPRMANPPLLY